MNTRSPRPYHRGTFAACHKSTRRAFWFGSYSECKRKAGKTGFVREVKDNE